MATKTRQNWSLEQDTFLCREVLVTRPYQFTKGSKESASGWSKITSTLNTVEGFAVTVKAVRDHFNHLLSKRKAQKNIEEKASGIEIEENEIDVILDEILEDVEMCRELSNTQSEAKRLADLDEKERAEEIRKTAMETYGESKKRKNEGDDDLTSPRQKKTFGNRNGKVFN